MAETEAVIPNLADVVLTFHNYADGCCGLITTNWIDGAPEVSLDCEECGECVARMDLGMYEQLMELLVHVLPVKGGGGY